MPEYQVRVIEEKDELSRKLGALSLFIDEGAVFPTLPAAEQARLRYQRLLMTGYLNVLVDRIGNFPVFSDG